MLNHLIPKIAPEGRTSFIAAMLTASAAFFVLFGYEIMRAASDTVVKQYFGTSGMAWSLAVSPLVLIFVLYIYNFTLSRLGARRTLIATCLFSALCMVVGFIGLKMGLGFAAVGVFLLREVYIVLIIEQFWSYLDSFLKVDEAKSYNGLIIAISTIGSISGGFFVGGFAKSLGTEAMLIAAAISLLPAAFLSHIAYQKRHVSDEVQALSHEHKELRLGLRELFHSRLLLIIFAVVIIAQMLSASLTLDFQAMLSQQFTDNDAQTAFSGRFHSLVNGAALFYQLILTPMLLKRFGVRVIIVLVPLANVIGASLAFFAPSQWTICFAYLHFKALDYSLFRAAKEVLFIPFDFHTRFRAKEFIDTFGYRFGKGVASASIASLQSARLLVGNGIAIVAVLASVIWLSLTPKMLKYIRLKDLH